MTKAARAMRRAWDIVRKAIYEFGGKARDYMAEALRIAWREVAPVEERIEELEGLGFKRWQKAGYDRMYINATALGLEVDYYKTGNVASAYLDGEKISNRYGRELVSAKTYIDLKTGKMHGTNQLLLDKARELSGIFA